jgi:hypothetical protein
VKQFLRLLLICSLLGASGAGVAGASGPSASADVKAIDHEVTAVKTEDTKTEDLLNMVKTDSLKADKALETCEPADSPACTRDAQLVTTDADAALKLIPIVSAAVAAIKQAEADAARATSLTSISTLRVLLNKVNAILGSSKANYDRAATAVLGVRG